jgi:hypothetical protein
MAWHGEMKRQWPASAQWRNVISSKNEKASQLINGERKAAALKDESAKRK